MGVIKLEYLIWGIRSIFTYFANLKNQILNLFYTDMIRILGLNRQELILLSETFIQSSKHFQFNIKGLYKYKEEKTPLPLSTLVYVGVLPLPLSTLVYVGVLSLPLSTQL